MTDSTGAQDRPPAPPDYVKRVPSFFGFREMPPERYVALHSHGWYAASWLIYSYPDPELDAYVRRVDELMSDYENLDALRRQWLSPEEHEKVSAEIAAMDDPNYDA